VGVGSERVSGYIPTLDGWRAVAILGVLIYHSTTSLFYPAGPYPSYEALRIIQTGSRGVDIFFAISGFLICSRLLQERARTGHISLRGFYVRRVFRILPPYFVYLGVLALVATGGLLVVKRGEFLSCALFLRNYYAPIETHGWYTGHFWSLAVEEHFYLFWPLLLVACGPRRARPAAVMLALIVPAWRLLGQRLGLTPLGDQGGQRTDFRLDSLFWGCWAALLLDVPDYRARITRWLNPWVWLAVVAALVGLARYEPFLDKHWQSLLLPWLLVGTVLHPTWSVSRLLEAGPVRWVGRLSYSLYVWQQLWLLGSWRVSRPFPLGAFQELPLSLVVTFACAVVSYYLVERPLTRLGARLSQAPGRGQVVDGARDPARPGPNDWADSRSATAERAVILTAERVP
jgi:peptidoglycan/LPS O-acetylase OafA/YrhL